MNDKELRILSKRMKYILEHWDSKTRKEYITALDKEVENIPISPEDELEMERLKPIIWKKLCARIPELRQRNN